MLGPLVICGCAVEEKKLGDLKSLGLADSKVLTPDRREQLAVEIRRIVDLILLRSLTPVEVDGACAQGGLNRAEAAAMTAIIREAKPGRAYLDGLTGRPEKFGRDIEKTLMPFRVQVISENKADTRYPVVQAAAIVAKVTRDAAIAELRGEFGEIGSGYPGDPRTIAFLEKFKTSGDYPPCVRRSWSTVEREENELFPTP